MSLTHSDPTRPLLTLSTTLEQFDGLHAAHAKVRATSKTVTVDRQALINLLMDHAQLTDALRKSGRVHVPNP